MKSKLFEQVLEECNFANLPSKYEDSVKKASVELGFTFSKVGKDLFEIVCEREKTKDILEKFKEAELKDPIYGGIFDKFRLKFKCN
jgi:hypothetical protein